MAQVRPLRVDSTKRGKTVQAADTILRVAKSAWIWYNAITMKSLLCAFAAIVAGTSTPVHGASVDVVYPTEINVKSFGAVGDGVHDDTAAIRAAVEAAEKARSGMPYVRGARRYYAAHLYCDEGPVASLVFPEGVYKVSGTVFFRRFAIIRGVGKARIAQTDPSATTFYFHHLQHVRVENLGFIGGRVQVDLSTLNQEAANICLKDCLFRSSTGPAVRSISWKDKTSRDRGWRANVGEYRYNEETRAFEKDPRYADKENLIRCNNSTMMVVDGCTFDRCAKAMDYACDGSVLRNCRILTPRTMAGGAVRVTNRIHVFGLKVVVDRDQSLKQSVFEATPCFNLHDSSLLMFVEDSSVRTLDGSGVCFVESTTVPRYRSSTIALRNLDLMCAGCPEGAIVHCAAGTSPNMVSVVNCRERGKGRVKSIVWETEPTPEFLKSICNYSHVGVERQYRFCISGNSKNIDATLPKWAAAHCDAYFTGPDASPPVGFSRVREPQGRTFVAAEHGVVADGRTDMSGPLRALLAEAAKTPDSVVVLPAGNIMLGDTVEVSGKVAVAGSGMTAIEGLPPDRDVFRVAPGSQAMFRNLILLGGRRGISCEPGSGAPAEIELDNCRSFGAHDAAIHFVSAGRPRASKLRVVNGVSYSRTFYRGDADASFDGVWVRLLPSVEDDSAPMKEVKGFENLQGGRLVLRDCLGVPYIVHHRTPTDSEMDPKLDKEEYRWVDNAGEFYSQCTRYGGERGGVCPIFSRGKGPVCIEGEHANFWANNMQRSAIVNDAPGADCRVFDVVFPFETMWLPDFGPAWRSGVGAPLVRYGDWRPVCALPVPEAMAK